MLVETIMLVASAGVSAGAFALSQRAGATLRGGFHGIGEALRQLPLGDGGPDPDADLLRVIERAEHAQADAAAGDRGVGAGGAGAADRGDRRGDRDPG